MKTKRKYGILFALLYLFFFAYTAHAVPTKVAYQGKLFDKLGVPINGSVDLTFSFYTAETDGNLIWNETQTNVPVSEGFFNVQLGKVNPILELYLNGNSFWLEVKVNTDAPMFPRQEVSSVIYALQSESASVAVFAEDAGTVEGKHAADLKTTSFLDLIDMASDSQIPSGVARDTEIMPKVLASDGSGSGLDADTVDGKDAADLKTTSFLDLTDMASDSQIPSGVARDTEIMPRVLASDGSGSGLDADTLDGKDSTGFAESVHNHDIAYYTKSQVDTIAAAIQPQTPLHRVIVAQSGGDYTSVSAALAAITPTAADPYVIEVMPGTYTDNITMKSYVHLRGAGREVTTIQTPPMSGSVISLISLTNTAISGMTIKGGGASTCIIKLDSSSSTISGNMIIGNTINGNVDDGICNYNKSSTIISENTITGGVSLRSAIENASSSATIIGNKIYRSFYGIVNNNSYATIMGNMIYDNFYFGIFNVNSSPTISGNTIVGNIKYGIINYSSSPKITNNTIADNGGTSFTDIYVDSTSTPNISFNIYDDITGTTGTGLFNVKSDGTAAPNP